MRITISVFLLSLLIIFLAFVPRNAERQKLIDRLFTEQLKKMEQGVLLLKKELHTIPDRNNLKSIFLDCRISYKMAAVLIDYFNPYESRLLNGANLSRTEEDVPDKIVLPQGFQVLEEILYTKSKNINREKVIQEADNILTVINRLLNEPDRHFKFTDSNVWDAMRSAILRTVTQGISGFDSPVAFNSIHEAATSIETVKEIINLYKKDIKNINEPALEKIITLADSAIIYLKANSDFNSFDRLFFIRKYAGPLYSVIVSTRIQLGYWLPVERRPVDINNPDMFSDKIFDINFFSPNERFKVTPERIELGKKLFYDVRLSGTENRSCATCHIPEKAFTDGLPVALSVDGKTYLTRNTPTLWNSALQTRQFYDSRTSKLENQLSDVLHNENEMKGSLKKSAEEFKTDLHYRPLFDKAYENINEPVTEYTIANAISSYVRSLVSFNSRFDQYLRGDENKMNETEKKGFNLFMGKAKCATCHFFPLFNGLVPPEFNETESEVLGVPTSNKKKSLMDMDEGKYNYTRSVVHRYAFKTPTVRNIELTAPYMHNGVFKTLKEVMDFYNKGGGSGLGIAPETQTLPAEKLNLTKKEIIAIIAFMKTLTDTSTAHTD